MNRRLFAFCVLMFSAHGGIASAQNASEPLLGRSEVAAGVSWTGPASSGNLDATLTTPGGDRYRLFSTSTEVAGAPAFDVRLGRKLTRVIQAELAISYSSPSLTTSISNDAENGAPTVASESIRQVSVVGGAVVYLPRWRVGSRILPLVSGGGGYLGQLNEGNKLAQTGPTYYVGGGAMIPLGSRGRPGKMHQFGLRVDVRALVRSDKVTIDGTTHVSPAVAVSAFARF